MKPPHLFIISALATGALAGPPPLATGIAAFLDLDDDGVISEAERQAFVQARKEARGGGSPNWDSNGDGRIDNAERAGAVAALQAKVDEKRAELFAAIAGDDGVLTIEEFSTLHPFSKIPSPTVQRLFDLIDENGDDLVTLEEFLTGVGGAARPPDPIPPPSP